MAPQGGPTIPVAPVPPPAPEALAAARVASNGSSRPSASGAPSSNSARYGSSARPGTKGARPAAGASLHGADSVRPGPGHNERVSLMMIDIKWIYAVHIRRLIVVLYGTNTSKCTVHLWQMAFSKF